jgi:hypothetical protein
MTSKRESFTSLKPISHGWPQRGNRVRQRPDSTRVPAENNLNFQNWHDFDADRGVRQADF